MGEKDIMLTELAILDLIQTWRTAAGDALMPLFSMIDNHGEVWIALTLILLLHPKTRRCGAAAAVALILEVLCCNVVLKPLTARIRPCDVNTAVTLLIRRPTDFSFPSGHTASSFAAVSACFFGGRRKLAAAALLPAVLISFSRLYLYVHWPSDVLAGLVIGLAAGWTACRILTAWERRRPAGQGR